MIKSSILLAATVVALSSLATSARAAFSAGSQGFADTGNPTVNAADINNATSFLLGTVVTNESRTGDFLQLAPQTLVADGPLTLTNPSLFTLSNAAFGLFQATSVVEVGPSNDSIRSFEVRGVFTGGTAFGSPSTPTQAVAALSFTQVGGPNGAISGSLTLSAVPEPASMAMVGLGLAGVGGLALRRRSAK